MSKEYQAKQAALTAEHIAKQDIVITTALIPGRPAPKLVSAAMVQSMKPGSVIVDLAVERGGNVDGAVPGAVITLDNGVKIVGYLNVPGRVAASASLLYARNLFAFLETMVDKSTKQLAINRDDELVKATMLTDGGRVVHPNFAGKEAVPAAKPIIPGQNRGDDPAVKKAAKGTEPGLDIAPKKAAKKPAAARKPPVAKPKPVTPGKNRGDA
jgi:NAD(P) transhydrogenase subunit alpha